MDVAMIQWGTVADWVSGLGSLSAVVVALYLARSAQRVRLEGYCGFRAAMEVDRTPQDLFFISVTNVGSRHTVVTGIWFRIGVIRRRYVTLTLFKDRYSVGLPVTLADGEEAHWGMPLDQERSWLHEAFNSNIVRSRWDIRTLRLQIHTSNGGHSVIPIDREVREALRQRLAGAQ